MTDIEKKSNYNMMFNALNELIKKNEELLNKSNKKEIVNTLKATIKLSRVAQFELSKHILDVKYMDSVNKYYNSALEIYQDIKRELASNS